MLPTEMHPNEVQHYASPILVKNREFYATITSERLIIEGGPSPREFKVSSIVSADPCKLETGEPGLRLVVSTPDGQKEMVWGFPVANVFKAGEQEAWTDQIAKVTGEEKPFSEGKERLQNRRLRLHHCGALHLNRRADQPCLLRMFLQAAFDRTLSRAKRS